MNIFKRRMYCRKPRARRVVGRKDMLNTYVFIGKAKFDDSTWLGFSTLDDSRMYLWRVPVIHDISIAIQAVKKLDDESYIYSGLIPEVYYKCLEQAMSKEALEQ